MVSEYIQKKKILGKWVWMDAHWWLQVNQIWQGISKRDNELQRSGYKPTKFSPPRCKPAQNGATRGNNHH